jgi:formylglycine-generating enzyme required for sulfatase activity
VSDRADVTDGAADASAASDVTDGAADADRTRETGGPAANPCPTTRGGPMVSADGECIDATEVTVSQYDRFLVSAGASLLPLPEPCAWVTTLEPDSFTAQLTNPDRPVVDVNWCHAFHYCAWANKRLCGRVGGGAALFGDAGMNPRENQWLRACTKNGTQPYTYGPSVIPGACSDTVTTVGSRPACDGPYPGLVDMLGNAGEWIDACVEDAALRMRDGCTVLGEELVRDEGSCYHRQEISRYSTSARRGFRCCGL